MGMTMDKLDRPCFGNGTLFLHGKAIGSLTNVVATRPKCEHDHRPAPDLFVAGERDRFRCTKCGDIV